MVLPPAELSTFLPDTLISPSSPTSFTMSEDNKPIPEENKPMSTGANDLFSFFFERISELDLDLLDIFSQEKISLMDDIA